MTAEEVKELEQADGGASQKICLEDMIKHHNGAIQMAQIEIQNGRNPDAVKLARSMVESQQGEITTMNELLAKL